jgi:hypothetical protein
LAQSYTWAASLAFRENRSAIKRGCPKRS